MAFTDTAFGGALAGRVRADLADQRRQRAPGKLDFRLSPKHNATLKYNYTRVEPAERHLRRGLLGPERQRARAGPLARRQRQPDLALLVVALERVPVPVGARRPAAALRREPINPATRPAVPGHRHRLRRADGFAGYRIGMPFFIPAAHGVRLPVPGARQHLAAQGQPPVQARRRVEPDRREPDLPRVRQRAHGVHLGERVPQLRGQRATATWSARDDVTNAPTPSQTTGACPAGEHITGPVALYLQQAGVSAAHGRGGRHSDDHPARAGAVPPGQLEAAVQPDA